MKRVSQEHLTAFIIENQERAYRLAYSYLKNREEALDAVQAAACKAIEKQGSLKDAGAVRAWFTRILVNVCMDMLRTSKRMVPTPPEELDAGSYEDPQPEDGSLARRVEALPPEIGSIIKLRFYEEMTLKEISEATSCKLSTVKTRLYKGLEKLRVSLEGAERNERI